MRSALISQQKERHSDARRLALTAVLASVAALLSLSSLSIPFPLLPFLRFDLAEVPDILSFMLLNLHSSFDPIIGPTMKFMAVFATMLGLYVGTFFVKASFSKKRVYASLLFSGTVLRFIIMIPPTFLLYYLISPTKYLPFAVQSLSEFGIHVSGILAAALLVTIITGIYNITHALLT